MGSWNLLDKNSESLIDEICISNPEVAGSIPRYESKIKSYYIIVNKSLPCGRFSSQKSIIYLKNYFLTIAGEE
jgi:hypothetical protein